MIVSINLKRLEGAEEMIKDGIKGIFVPYVQNRVWIGKNSAFLRLYMLQKEDRFGNPYMVARSLTSTEMKRRKPLTFLGSAQYEHRIKNSKNKDQYIRNDDPF